MTKALKRTASALVLAFLAQGPALATTYYVSAATGRDSNVGTSTTAPFATILHAASLTKPGDNVDVMNGTYGPFVIQRSGASPSSYITYQPAPGQSPIVQKTTLYENGISVEGGVSYIAIRGFNVVGNSQALDATQAQAIPVGDNRTHGHCIAVGNGAHHIKIVGNQASYCPGAGIMYLGDYGWIFRNTVHNNCWWDKEATSGIDIRGYPIDASTQVKIQVYNNLVYSNQQYSSRSSRGVSDGHGIIVDSEIDTAYAGRVVIYNNISMLNGGKGIGIFRSDHVDVYNNTTFDNSQSALMPIPFGSNGLGGEITVGLSDDVKVENNIQFGNPYVPMIYAGVGLVGDGPNIIWDYNILWAGQNAVPLGPHDIVADPGFVPDGSFRLAIGSPAIGSGTPSLVPPYDYNLAPRRPGSVDRGAYRYQ